MQNEYLRKINKRQEKNDGLIPKNIPNYMKDETAHLEAKQNLSRIELKETHTEIHHSQTVEIQRQKENSICFFAHLNTWYFLKNLSKYQLTTS